MQVKVFHNLEITLKCCKINRRPILVLGMVNINLDFLYEESNNFKIKSLNCIEYCRLFLLIQQLIIHAHRE